MTRASSAADQCRSAADDRPPGRGLGDVVGHLATRSRVCLGRLDRATGEAALSDYYGDYVDAGSSLHHVRRHPLRTAAAVTAIIRLPLRRAVLSGSPAGRVLHRALIRPGIFTTPMGWTGAAVLDVPTDPSRYTLGASRQTLRRKVRAAQRRGVTWRAVEDPCERADLLKLSNDAEVVHPDQQYRNLQPDNSDLLQHDLWLAAFDAADSPLLLSVIPTDGEWACLRYFRTLGTGPEHSDSRYLMFPVLVDALAARGVRHLVDTAHPIDLTNGLRHFQRMIGFRLVRVTARCAP